MTTAEEALQLRLQGFTYQAIGTQLGISRQRIQQLLAPPPAIRTIVVNAASGTCAGCGLLVGRSGHVHHKGSTNGDSFNDLANLELLCISCHRLTHTLTQLKTGDVTQRSRPLIVPRYSWNGPNITCLLCDHTWRPRVKQPQYCPKCQCRIYWGKSNPPWNFN